jgi:hypothetical protein
MFGGMDGFGGMGMGFRGGGFLMFLPHLLGQLLILALVVAGVIFLVRALSRPRAGVFQATAGAPAASVPAAAAVVPTAPLETTAAEPAPARTCASCGRELQADWTHCPHCGAKVETLSEK